MDWQWLVGVPVFTAAAVGLVPLLVPTFRWNRQISRDVQLWKDMPAGEEKDLLEAWITEQATRIREYREYIPFYDKALGWGLIVLWGAAIGFYIALFPTWREVMPAAVQVPFLVALGAQSLLVLSTAISMPRGRSMMGHTAAKYRDAASVGLDGKRRTVLVPIRRMFGR